MFTIDQEVIYLGMYTSSGNKDVPAKYKGKARSGLARIEITEVEIEVPYDRITDAKAYWKDKNDKDDSPRYIMGIKKS